MLSDECLVYETITKILDSFLKIKRTLIQSITQFQIPFDCNFHLSLSTSEAYLETLRRLCKFDQTEPSIGSRVEKDTHCHISARAWKVFISILSKLKQIAI
jgi:hypothetical protein